MQKMILLCRHFCSRTFSFSYVDIFVIVFRRTNNLFGPPPCHLRYFSKDKRKTLWGHKYCYCYRGRVVLPSRGGQIPGRGGKGKWNCDLWNFSQAAKMKLRRRRKEGCHCVLCHPPARPRPESRSRSPLLLPSFHSPPPPSPHQPAFRRPSSPSATDRESKTLQLSLPQLFRFSLSSS